MNKKHSPVIKKIIRIFEKGIILSQDTLDYINSAFSFPCFDDFKKILHDYDNSEITPLYQLIFSPDIHLSIQLENTLGKEIFSEWDQQEIVSDIIRQTPNCCVMFKKHKTKMPFAAFKYYISHFVSALNISRVYDKRLLNSIENHIYSKYTSLVLKVKIRNTRFPVSGKRALFLCDFIKKINSLDPDFEKMFDFTLNLFDAYPTAEIKQAFSDKKQSCTDTFKAAHDFEKVMKNCNMETIMLQKIKVPAVNKKKITEYIEIMDKITYLLF